MSPAAFLRELKRRKVFRVVALYAVGAWVAIEVASTVFPLMELPVWAVKLVLGLALAGLPIVLVLSWTFDLVEGRVEATPSKDPASSDAVSGIPAPDQRRAEPRPQGTRTAGRIAAVGGVVIIALAGGAFLVQRDSGPVLETNRVVIDAFENRTGDPELDVVGTMAADWLARSLQELGSLDVVPTTSTLGIGAAAGNGAAGVAALSAEFAARIVVTGSYYLEADSLRIVAEVTDAADRQILHSTPPISAPLASPSAGLTALQQDVAGFLALRSGFDGSATSFLRPPTYAAYREYATGLDLFGRQEYSSAIPYFQAAIALDSTFVPAILYAAISYMNQGRSAEAERFAQQLERIRNQLTPYEQLFLDWLTRVRAGDFRGALRAARRVVEYTPAVPSWRYLVGLHALSANRPFEVVDALDGIDREGEFALRWAPFWSVYTSGLHLTGGYADELEVARQGLELHPNNRPLRSAAIRALIALGRSDDAVRVLDDASFDQTDGGLLLRLGSIELLVHGHTDAARAVAERAVVWYRSRLEGPDGAGYRLALARALHQAEQYEEARSLFENIVAEQPGQTEALGYLGVIAARLGHRPAAEHAYERLAIGQPPGQPPTSTALFHRARVAAALGQRDQAVSLLRRAIGRGYAVSLRFHECTELLELRGYPPFEELIDPRR